MFGLLYLLFLIICEHKVSVLSHNLKELFVFSPMYTIPPRQGHTWASGHYLLNFVAYKAKTFAIWCPRRNIDRTLPTK
jgi:hypothetical protein